MPNANILFQNQPSATPQEAFQGVLQNQSALNQFQQQPMQNRLLQAQTVGQEQRNQAGQQQMDQEYAKFALQDMATDWGSLKPLLASGDMTNANVAIAQRIDKILKRGGDPSDTIELRDRINSGQITPQQAIAEVDGALEGARQSGLLGKGSMDDSYYTTVQTSSGVYRFNNRTGQYEPMAGPDGKPVLPTAADPNVASAKRGAELRQDLAYKPQIAESVAQSEADVALKTKPKIESAVTAAKETVMKSADIVKKIGEEQEVGRILDMAMPLLDDATESLGGAAVDAAGALVGVSTKGAQAAARLKSLEGALIMKMPRMEGPQSNMDQMLYRQMAAQIGDATVPAEVRKAAVDTLRSLNQRYSGAQQPQPPAQGGKQGGQIMIDANGNRAMVYPDGSFEELQ
jgi:hypothetical protein